MKVKFHMFASGAPMLLCLMMCVLLPAQLSARNFWYTYEGHTLAYTVLDEIDKTVMTKEGNLVHGLHGDSGFTGNSVTGNLVIPSQVSDGTNTYTVTRIGYQAFVECSGLTSVVIPSSVTTIGESAFERCEGLTSIVIPNSVTSIGEGAFKSCKNLTSIDISNTVTTIGSEAFLFCYDLTEVDIPNSVTNIGSEAFGFCSGLTEMVIPNSVKTIGERAFWYCSGLTSFVIPSSVTTISKGVLSYCDGLINIDIPNSVTDIGDEAFKGCNSLTSVIIPQSVTSIGKDAFKNCPGLKKSAYPSSIWNHFGSEVISVVYPVDSSFISEDGYIWSDDKTELYFVPLSAEGHFKIPNTVTSIGNYAFASCTRLTSVDIPKSVASIGLGAFEGCFGLTDISIPNTVITMGNRAFASCTGLTSVDISNSLTSIGLGVFDGCSGLKSVAIPHSVISIEDKAFNKCTGLTSIAIPNSVTAIGENTFSHCAGLTSVILPQSVTSIGKNAFNECLGLKKSAYPSVISNPFHYGRSVSYPSKLSYISEDGYIWSEDKTQLYFVPLSAEGHFEIPNTVTSIGNEALAACVGLTSIDIPSSVTSIGDEALASCTGLTSIDIPSSVTSIGQGAFAACTGLKSVDIPNSLTSISQKAFASCKGLTSVDIPNTVTSIGDYAFNKCTGLTSITIPNSVTSIGKGAFYGCSGLTSIVLPISVTTIGYEAFSECSGLKKSAYPSSIGNHFPNGISIMYPVETSLFSEDGSIWNDDKSELLFVPLEAVGEFVIPKSVNTIGIGAFFGCSNLTNIVIPPSVTSIGESAFSNCLGLTSIELPNSLRTLSRKAFLNCSGLTSVVIPNSVTGIEAEVFLGCSAMKTCKIENSRPPSFWDDSFHSYQMEVIVPEGALAYYIISDWSKFTNLKDAIGLSAIRFSDNVFNYRLISEDEVALVGGSYSQMTSVSIPERVVYKDKFMNVTVIADAFNQCDKITTLVLPKCLRIIGRNAFSWCTGLTNVTLHDDLESIGDYAFNSCKNLKTFNHKRLGAVGVGVFKDCINLQLDTITIDWPKVESETFYNCSGLKSIKLTDDVTAIGSNAFYNCKNIETVSIPASVNNVGYGAFGECSNISTLVLEDGLETIKIGDKAFSGTPIQNFYIGREYTYSDNAGIRSGIKALTYGNTITSIPSDAFKNASNLCTVNFGSSIEMIGANAFSGCALTEVVLPPHVRKIGKYAFSDNDIKNIAIGSEVTEIGEKAFDGSNSIVGISITAINPPNANNNTFSFYDCPLYVSPGCVDTYYNFTKCWYRFTGYDLIPANKVVIDGGNAEVSLKPGENMKLSATLTPADASLPYIYWRSTNPAIATVDSEGNVTCTVKDGISRQFDDDEINKCEIIAETLYANVVAKVIVRGPQTGVEDIVHNDVDNDIARPNDIITLQGVCLKRNASQDDIDLLGPGLYIIGGKKMYVR